MAVLAVLAALGSGLIGGVFFAFSVFVMKALGRLPAGQGVAAMQAINVAVLNPVFFLAFFGTGALSVLLGAAALFAGDAAWAASGSLLYLAGSIGVTLLGNVPLNEALARHPAESPEAAEVWQDYLARWTFWNHLRTAAATAAAACFIMAL
jgi:uncharacterized membrane protein